MDRKIDLVEQTREKGYAETKSNWQKVLPIIQKNKEKLHVVLREDAMRSAHGSSDQLDIELRAADALLEMDADGVEQVCRDYDEFFWSHKSLLDDKEVGFRLEAQRHWIPILISLALRLS